VRTALDEGRLDAVMFFSPRSARLFLTLAQGLPIAGLTAFCISPATADVLASGIFAEVRIADRPNQAAMLSLADRA
jgi:uroporphyrinogen-III synthase